ncbi:MAG: VTT domain-containing protein [Rickettsiales bacterium]|jgi:membrane protein YqaA with SNARE-associated domain|nr:VTT domain-containing protein [Rickettsiales bacterium]
MKLQDYLLKKADSAMALWLVFIGTLAESIFLFIPPEVFMTPPIVANKKRTGGAIMAAAAGSLVGGLIAYLIGVWLFDSVGLWLINTFSSIEVFATAQQMFNKYGAVIILITAFTPVPYKVLSICAGFIGYNPIIYLGLSAIFRTGRFAIIGWILWRFQERANAIIKKYFWQLTLLAITAACAGIFLIALI